MRCGVRIIELSRRENGFILAAVTEQMRMGSRHDQSTQDMLNSVGTESADFISRLHQKYTSFDYIEIYIYISLKQKEVIKLKKTGLFLATEKTKPQKKNSSHDQLVFLILYCEIEALINFKFVSDHKFSIKGGWRDKMTWDLG